MSRPAALLSLAASCLLLAQQFFASACLAQSALMPQSANSWPEADRLFHSDPLWLGGDAAFSVDLGKGRVLWLFGDSFVAREPGQKRSDCRMVRNSLALEKGYEPSTAEMKFYWRKNEDGQAQSFFPEHKDRWLWPMHGVRLADKLLLIYSVIGPNPVVSAGAFAFQIIRSTAFLITNPDDEPDRWQYRELALPANPWHLNIGVSALLGHDFVYLFAFDEPKHDVYLARLRAKEAEHGLCSNLEWWCGDKRWLKQSFMIPRGKMVMECAKNSPTRVFEGGSTEFSVQWNAAGHKFVEVQSSGFGASHITMRTADQLIGPWSEAKEIFVPPESREREPFVYSGKAHPELRGDELVITYATNGSEKRLAEDMSIYFPRFVRCRLHGPVSP
jgi:hypothetical protein